MELKFFWTSILWDSGLAVLLVWRVCYQRKEFFQQRLSNGSTDLGVRLPSNHVARLVSLERQEKEKEKNKVMVLAGVSHPDRRADSSIRHTDPLAWRYWLKVKGTQNGLWRKGVTLVVKSSWSAEAVRAGIYPCISFLEEYHVHFHVF